MTSDNEYSDSTDTTTIRPCQGGRSLRNGREHKIVKADKDSCHKFLSYYSSVTVFDLLSLISLRSSPSVINVHVNE